MDKRKLVKLLKKEGFEMRQGHGDHEIWKKGEETVVIADTKQVSKGLVRQAMRAIENERKREG